MALLALTILRLQALYLNSAGCRFESNVHTFLCLVTRQTMVGWCCLVPSEGWERVANAPRSSSNVPENPGRSLSISTPLKRVGTWHPITAQVAPIDGFRSVASYYSLGRRLHYSVPVKHGDQADHRFSGRSQS